jgi:hypothetical protein
MKQPIRNLFLGVIAMAAAAPLAMALPTITAVEILEDSQPGERIPRFTGQTFDHPNEGANFTVGTFQEDCTAFVDRLHEWNGASTTLPIPDYLLGAEYIMFGNDNRENNPFLVQITLADPADVYLLIDNRHPSGNSNATPPNLENTMLWVTQDGWQPVRTGHNRRANADEPDEVGVDEGGDGVGPGVGLNQWSSVYTRRVAAGTFTVSTPENGGQNMYGVVVRGLPRTPNVTRSAGNLLGVTFEVTDGSDSGLQASSVQLTVDDEVLSSADVQVTPLGGGVTRIRYLRTLPFPSQSNHTALLTFMDTASPAQEFTHPFSWSAEYYATLTEADAAPAGSVDTSASGFTARVVQTRDNVVWPGPDLPNNTVRAELQLAGILRDPISGNFMPNYALPGPNAGGSYTALAINWNQEMNTGGTGAEIGNFQTTTTPSLTDDPIPGVPGSDPQSATNLDNIAAEIIGYLDLTAGLHRFGVNSDDGFRVTAGRDASNPANVMLGQFVGGRGSADTLFYVLVEQAGVYPVRLIWYEGGGGANLEFFSVNQANPEAALERLPVNFGSGIRSYARSSAPQAPAAAVYPLAGATGVPANAPIQAVLIPRGAAATPGSVQLTVNGTPANVTTTTGQQGLLVEHIPADLWPSASANTAVLTYSDSNGTENTVTWSFTVEDYSTLPVIPAGFAAAPGTVNTGSSGFTVDMYQMDDGFGVPVARTGFADNNSADAAEHQINRRFINPNTSQPYENIAWWGNPYHTQTVNWNQQAPDNAGDFTAANGFADELIPGLWEPGDIAANNWIVAEAVAYLELKKGRHRLGVNSDDGFKVTTGANARDAIALQLGIFNTGRGAANTFFDFIVEQDGIYPFRLLYWEGTGGASVEFKSQDPVTSAQTLINDRARAQGVRAYQTLSGTAPARISGVSPAPGAVDVLPTAPITVSFEDLGATPATLVVNGQAVTTQQSTVGNVTTLTYQATEPFMPGSTVNAAVTRGGSTSPWSFEIRNAPTVAITSPANNAVITPAPANVTITATASIVGANITVVEFFDGQGNKLGEDTTEPYQLELTNAQAGRYTVIAHATDDRELTGISAPVSFQVGVPLAINFQATTSAGYPGYLPDFGDVYGDRLNGEFYGWAEDITAEARDRNNPTFAPDERYDTFNHSSRPAANPNANFWEIALPNGRYGVFAVAGEPSNIDSVYHFQAEGVTVVQGTPTTNVRFYEGWAAVNVTDGRLTLTNGPGASNNKIAFIEIYSLPDEVEQPVLSVSPPVAGSITVTWTGGGTLWRSAAVDTGWESTGDSDGSYSEPTSTGTRFFQVRR